MDVAASADVTATVVVAGAKLAIGSALYDVRCVGAVITAAMRGDSAGAKSLTANGFVVIPRSSSESNGYSTCIKTT